MSDKKRDHKGRILRTGERQREDGRYEYRYRDIKGEPRSVYSWKLVDTDKAPAGKICTESLREMEKKIQRDLEDSVNTYAATRTTLNSFFDSYIETKYELKQSTRTNYKYMYRKYVSESLGLRDIASIRYSDIKKFYIHLIKDIGFKPNSMEIINTILHPIFTTAVRDGLIRMNPSDGVMAEIKKSHDWEKPKRHALSIEEQEAFINFMAGSDIYRHWLPLFTVFLGTGCRVGEIIGLRWKDCDFENRTISINHNLVYRQQDSGNCEMHVTTPKTAAGCRTVPMLAEVRRALLLERKRQMKEGGSTAEIDGYTDFVFTNRYGYVHNPQTINRAIERIYTAFNEEEAANAEKERRKSLVIRHFSVHNLRHTFCTRFCENETNIKVIQDIMGHSDISTTMNIYAEATESKKKESFDNLEGKIKIS